MTLDDRGRLWVVESHSYPNWLPEGKQGRDRVLIFEDKKGTGHFDSCKVFWDKGTNLSGIAVGFGGVWLCATPYLLFIPMHTGEDKPAGPPKVVLDGWSLQAKHNVFNTLVWGPDGFLYGCNGIMATSNIGRPGTPMEQRVALNCGVWRYHPVKETFESFAWGTTNPWGLDFDDYGEMFITNCVIKHLFHVVPGAHFDAHVRAGPGPELLRPDGQLCRPHPLGRRRLDHLARRPGSTRRRRRRSRPRRRYGLSRRQLAQRISQSYFHVQPPRQSRQSGRAGASRLRLCRPSWQGLPAGARFVVSRPDAVVRARRRRLRQRLARHRRMSRLRPRRTVRPHLQSHFRPARRRRRRTWPR